MLESSIFFDHFYLRSRALNTRDPFVMRLRQKFIQTHFRLKAFQLMDNVIFSAKDKREKRNKYYFIWKSKETLMHYRAKTSR